jgi:hypothetical protein
MSEIKRDAAADLAMCEAAYPGPWRPISSNGDFVLLAKRVIAAGDESDIKFITESREALPYWIQRSVAAEAEVERLREALRAISTYEPPPGCEDIGIEVMNRIAKRALEKT